MNRLYSFLVILLTPFVRLVYPYRLKGRAALPDGGAIICANHSSNMDPVILAIIFGPRNYMTFMAKIELFRIPVLGWLIKKLGAIPVDRGSSDIEALRRSINVLKEGHKLMLFPEGTRVSEDDAVAAKTGAVRLASRHNVPIVPVFISRDKRPFRRYDVCIGEPIVLGKLKHADYPAASEHLMERIAAMNPEKL
ncbi:MAG TPA: 1-acyl-sn-glycerol-3-phosphate acyltransferase [Firmicutes bacterium]|nr:1-acyl-sn-glycerol-3-phosphate acyltransferase [Bacillota bacterium]